MISEEESNNNEEVEASVEALQCLYAVFLPSHLCLEARSPEKLWKIKKRRLVYTGDLWTTHWQKNVKRNHAAKGCTTLDGFITRKVCS